ncbi:hypothetical protein GF312_15175 [Candidatus Poribacteria bacterium]|nr:hypothetical protein [Candidatus Poribacteria bacterium]
MNKKFIIAVLIVISLTAMSNIASATKQTTLGFIFMGDDGPFTEPALEFALRDFDTVELSRDDLTDVDLSQFAVLWWHEGDSDPGALSDGEIQAFLDYAESGGAILLTGWAIRYATPMGLEDVEARQFGPVEDDGSNVGLILLEEWMDTPLLWDDLSNLEGDPPQAGDKVQVNSTGYPKSGDYFDNIWQNFINVAHVWEGDTDYADRIAAFGYWEAGSGKVFNMNWRLPNFHENNEDIEMLEILTENVIEWLASESAYLAVNPSAKMATTWGNIK